MGLNFPGLNLKMVAGLWLTLSCHQLLTVPGAVSGEQNRSEGSSRSLVGLSEFLCEQQSAPKTGLEGLEDQLPVNVLIITAKGGGGHQIPAELISRHLKAISEQALAGQEPAAFEVPKKVFNVIDIIDISEGRVPTGLFNKLFSQEKWFALGLITSPRGHDMANRILSTFFYDDIKEQILGNSKQRAGIRPHIVISVMPTANNIINDICEKNNIPHMLIATDTDGRGFIRGIFNKNDSSKFRFFVPHIFDKSGPKELKKILDNITKKHKITTVGDIDYPLDPVYPILAKKIQSKDPATMAELDKIKREKLGMGPEDEAVLISIGAMGFGQDAIRQYVKAIGKQENRLGLSASGKKIHLVIACGKNQECFDEMQGLSKGKYANTGLVLHPQQWLGQEDMAKFMAISKFGVMKPGGNSINQAMAMGLPLLLKADSEQALRWEKFGKEQIKAKGFGTALTHVNWRGKIDKRNFIEEVEKMLATKERPKPVENNFRHKIHQQILNMVKGQRDSTFADL